MWHLKRSLETHTHSSCSVFWSVYSKKVILSVHVLCASSVASKCKWRHVLSDASRHLTCTRVLALNYSSIYYTTLFIFLSFLILIFIYLFFGWWFGVRECHLNKKNK
jgi:hypothetical protein